ncbi:MAG: LytR/AlgR family response regulator transcription factor [Bacillota bacterium]
MKLKVLLADDDYGMRLILRKTLKDIEYVEIIGEAENGEAALKLYEDSNADVVFLDVEMPVLSGVECAKRIMDINPRTFVIFVTAHEEYMHDAFELYAFDYLIKPFKIERIQQTMERIGVINQRQYEPIKHKLFKHEKGLDKLLVRNKEGISFIDMHDIIIIQRENRSTVIHTSHGSCSTSESLGDLEEKLDKSLFFRCHKSYIINLSLIDKIYPYGRWTYIVKLKNTDLDALVTHDKFTELEDIFAT